jgi:RNA polymerase sigma-70 factor (ECF subfamily)
VHDIEILKLLFDRSEAAIEELRKRFGSGLFGLAMRILGNKQDAEEAVNDTYLAIWDAIPPAHPDPLSPYVYKACRYTALNKLRNRTAGKRNSDYDLPLDELADILPGGTLEELLDAKALGKAISAFLDTLSSNDRVLFVRRYWFGDSVTELARQRLTTTGNLSVRLHRIRQKLKDYLYKEGFFL